MIFSDFFSHILISSFLGALLGCEREIAKKDASFRTFSLVCTGSCLFTLLSLEGARGIDDVDASRIAAQIVSGIGFLGAGVIFRSKEGITGLTTAALLWVAAGIGMAVGFNRFQVAFEATALVLLYMLVFRGIHIFLLGKR